MTEADLDHLFAAWSADDVLPKERAKLEAVLLSSPAARARFSAWCTTEMVIRQSLHVGQNEGTSATKAALASVTTSESSASSTQRSAGRRTSRRFRHRHSTKCPSASLPILAAAAIVLLALGALVLRSTATTDNTVVTGDIAQVQACDGNLLINGRAASVGTSLSAHAVVQLSESNAIIRMLGDNSTVTLSERAHLTITDASTLHLASGVATCSVAPQGSGRFSVVAPFARVEVVGTLFTVDADMASTLVSVVNGVVRVAPQSGGERFLHQGDEATVNASGFVEISEQSPEGIIDFVGIDTNTGMTFGNPVPPGGTLTIPTPMADHFSLRVNGQDTVKVIRILSKPQPGRLERILPFSIFEDTDGDYHPAQLEPGRHTIRVRAYADTAARIALGDACEITLVVP